MFEPIRWEQMFVPSVSPLEIIIRGSIIYVGTFILLRVVAKRELGGFAVSDLIVVVFIADAAQNGMAGEYRSVTDGLVLIAVLIGWALVLDRLAFHWPWFERLVKPPPLQVVRNGELMRKHMRQESLTEAELMAMMREQGVDDIKRVKAAYVEPDGGISVIKKQG